MEYKSVKNQNNIFIYSVCGRTGSTALQRYLNSSNEICIFGEPGAMKINNIFLNAIYELKKRLEWDQYKKKVTELKMLKKSYEKNNHRSFYPNALNPLEQTVEELKNIYCNVYTPPIPTKKIGFKEVTLSDSEDLEKLQEFFPQSHILFIFRNPIKQFRSVNKCNYFPYSNDVNHFLQEYERISNIYLEHGAKHNNHNFIENSILANIDNLHKLFKKINITKFDESLIGVKINSTSDHTLPPELIKTIEKSKAYINYKKMVNISKNLFASL